MAPVRILIVEDERIIGFDLRRRLGRMGHTVVGITASGEEAIAHAHRLQPDLVLMDVRFRGPMDGIEAAQHIWIQCRIPVVFMSGYTTVETLERIWRTVPSGYLSKPFFDDQLRMALERTLETRMALKRTMESRRRRTSRKRPHP
jgi:CheY-like chemotaxis protein